MTRWMIALVLGSLAFAQDSKQESKPDVRDEDVELRADRVPKTHTGGNCLIKNATVVTVTNAGILAETDILVKNGKIAQIGMKLKAPQEFAVIDASGKYVMPGIIDCHSHIANEGGLNEGSQSVTPEVRIGDIIDPTDVHIYRSLAGGVTAANVLHGSANSIGGQNQVIKLRYGKTAEEMKFEGAPRGIKFALGENVKQSNWGNRGKRFPNTREGVEATYRRAFTEAQEYRKRWEEYRKTRQGPPPRRDLRLETLVDILEGKIIVHCHSYRSDEILMIMGIAKEFGFKLATLQHVLEGYKVAPEMAEAGVGGSTFADWWAYKFEVIDAIPYNAALMAEAGVCVSINSDSENHIRRLNLEAAKAMKYGNTSELEALKMVTLNPAKQLGIEKRVGTIEVGKDADLAIFNGHPFSTFSRCVMTLVDGEAYFEERGSLAAHAKNSFGPDRLTRRSLPEMPRNAKGVFGFINAEIHPVTRGPIKNGTILVRNGRIEKIGKNVSLPDDATVIDVAGLSIYPGLIDAHSALGLTEIGSVAGTRDDSEIGSFQPDLRAIAAIHPDSDLIPVARANGITTVLAGFDGGVVNGQTALIHLDGWTPREMSVRDTLSLQINFPGVPAEAEKLKDEPAYKELREMFLAARQMDQALKAGMKIERNLKVEALVPYVRGERPVMITANSPRDIRAAVAFAEEFKLKMILRGGREAWKVAGFLAEKKIPVVVQSLGLPVRDYDPYDTGYSNAARLHAAGVRIAFTSDEASNARNLPYHAAMAVAYGLPPEEALKGITIYPAQMLGLDAEIGSLEEGKIADFIVTTGDPLEIVTDVVYVFIGGKPSSLETRHTKLYEKFRARIRKSGKPDSKDY